jgi:hypothetical protein
MTYRIEHPFSKPIGQGDPMDKTIEIKRLRARIERFHREVSMIRRATDDLPELKDINRMAREALTEGEDV